MNNLWCNQWSPGITSKRWRPCSGTTVANSRGRLLCAQPSALRNGRRVRLLCYHLWACKLDTVLVEPAGLSFRCSARCERGRLDTTRATAQERPTHPLNGAFHDLNGSLQSVMAKVIAASHGDLDIPRKNRTSQFKINFKT